MIYKMDTDYKYIYDILMKQLLRFNTYNRNKDVIKFEIDAILET
jgi:hypothetical protein